MYLKDIIREEIYNEKVFCISYKLEANKYVRLKFVYSSTSKVKVGIVNKSRNKVTLKEIKPNDIQKIKVPKRDTYSVYIQNNSDKKITVKGVIIL